MDDRWVLVPFFLVLHRNNGTVSKRPTINNKVHNFWCRAVLILDYFVLVICALGTSAT